MQDGPDYRIAVVIGVTAGFIIAVGNLYWQLDRTQNELSSLRSTTASEVSKLAEATHNASKGGKVVVQTDKKLLESMKEELAQQLSGAKTQAAIASQHARDAVNHANQLAAKLGEENKNHQQQVIGELGNLKEIEAKASARMNNVSDDVASIKTEVANTREELNQTVSELKKVTGDLGVQSGFIATNAKELAQLKAMGEKNYFDFHIERTNKPQRVGNVYVLLKKTDLKNGTYTLEVFADDKRTEKRERAIHEPVQFYVSRGRVLYEIVVNEIQKNYVIGYLATPKELMAKN